MFKNCCQTLFFLFLLFFVLKQNMLSANDKISDKLSYKIINHGVIIMNSSSKAIFKYQNKFYICFQNEDKKNICEVIKKKNL